MFIRNELNGVYYGINFIPDKAIPFLNSLSQYSSGFRHFVRSDFTGLEIADFIDWKLIVNKVIKSIDIPAMTNTPAPISIR